MIRAEFFDRLAGLGVTTAKISAALGEGFSGPSLSKFRSGERVPDRDKLLRLLALAEEKVGQPLPDGVREHVLEKYYAALFETNRMLHDFYRMWDERDEAVGELEEAREEHRRERAELVRCRASLQQVLHQVSVLEAEAKAAKREERLRQEREEAAEREVERLHDQRENLTREVRSARAGQQAARKEVRRLQDLLVQQTEASERSEAGLKEDNSALSAKVCEFEAKVAELQHDERVLRSRLEKTTAALEQAEARSGELVLRHAVVLRSRAEVGRRLTAARQRRRDLEDKQSALRQRQGVTMRRLTAAERRVADLEGRLVAAYRSRDALLEHPAAPGQAVAEAEETVDAAWQTYEVEISRIEDRGVVVPQEGTTGTQPPGTAETAEEPAPEPADQTADRDAGDTPPDPPSPPRTASSGPDVRFSAAIFLTSLGAILCVSIFLITVTWPDDWWPPSNDGQRNDAAQDGTSGEDGPADQGPVPRWSTALPHPLTERPALDGSMVVTAAWRGQVYGVDTRTGRHVWSMETSESVNDQPVASGGLAHTRTLDEVKTVDSRTGKLKWKRSGNVDWMAAAHGSLVTTSESTLTSLRQSDGDEQWSAKTTGRISGRPALTNDTVYVSAGNARLYAFDAKTGKVKWDKAVETGELGRSPLVAGTAVIVGTDEQIVAVDSTSGKELWRRDHSVVSSSDMAAADGLLIFTAKTEDGQPIVALDLKTGAQKWKYLNRTNEAQPVALSASADLVYMTYDSKRLCAHKTSDGTIADCFTNVNTMPGLTATADGVYVNSYNQRLYHFPKKEFK
ncbi:PQQ-binding-like beta-propeller repeat protein [Streptomyces wuyuanensis]|uniref:outer membrane protein assembly factor BamB family protein n=1 Tax=Streptomyces wuyuanensis TaxID=1196353 RepID=UPI00380B22A3